MDPERQRVIDDRAVAVCEARADLEAATHAVLSFKAAFADELVEELERAKADYGVALGRWREAREGPDDPRN